MKKILSIIGLGLLLASKTLGQDWTQMNKVNPSDGQPSDNFGNAVDISGDYAVVGSASEDGATTDKGAAYVYERSGGVWLQVAKLTGSDSGTGDKFGTAVSIDGTRIIVGAPFNDATGLNTGAVYIFDRSGGVWTQTAKVTPLSPVLEDQFGTSVDVSGNRIIVGVPLANNTFADQGAAYVFDKIGPLWTQIQKIYHPTPAADDNFGISVSLSGDRSLIGCYLDDHGGIDRGSAFVYNLISGVWVLDAQINNGDAADQDYFGYAVSLDGDRVLIGAHLDDVGATSSGSAYIFDRSGGVWSETAKLNASDIGGTDFFGRTLSLDGNRAVVGSYRNAVAWAGQGAAYVFELSDGFWYETYRFLASDAATFDEFGTAVAVSGAYVLVGAINNDDLGANSGSAYFYNGCSVPPSVEALASDVSLCDGDEVILNGSGALTYEWDLGVINGVAFVPGTGTTIYTVTGTDARGCKNTDNVSVNVFELPVVTAAASDDEVCLGDEVILNGSGAVIYDWEGSIVNGVPFVPDAGLNTFDLIGTDVNGCIDSTSIDILVHLLPEVVANASDISLCLGESLTLNGSGAEFYLWDMGVIDGISFIPGLGTVNYTVNGSDLNGCVGTDDVIVVVNPNPTVGALASETEICFGQELVLNGTGAVIYDWDGDVINGVAFIPSEGINLYTVVGTDANGCVGSDNIEVLVNEAPEVIALSSATSLCEGDEITLTASGDALTYEWNMGVIDGVPFIQSPGIVTYILAGTDEIGCESTDTVIITVYDPEGITISLTDDALTVEETVSGFINVFDNDIFPAESEVNELLSPINITYSFISGELVYTGFNAGLDSLVYEVCHTSCLTVCDTATVLITVIDYIPFDPGNVGFSNNGDEFTLIFDKLDQYPDNDLVVWNRWGDVVYEVFSYQNDWNGTYKNEKLSRGTYFYSLRVNIDGTNKNFNGYIEIIK